MSAEVIRQTSIVLPQWGGLEVPAILADGGVYFPIKYFCFAILGGIDDRPQRARIQRDAILRALARSYPVNTAGGPQDMVCLERLAIGRWLDRIDPEQVRADIRPQILQFQWELTRRADRLYWGEVDADTSMPMLVPAGRSQLQRSRATVPVRDQDARRFLLALADRIGQIEISQREIQGLLAALAVGAMDILPVRCPQCGYTWQRQGEEDGE